MNILIQDNKCWICGIKSNIKGEITMHHCIPKHLNPNKNVIIPICQKCHDKINNNDVRGLFSFGYKINKTLKEIKQMSQTFYSRISQVRKKEEKNVRNT